MSIHVYGIPNCDTIKKTLDWLADNHVGYSFHDYKKLGIDANTLEKWLTQKATREIVNLKSTTWKALSENDKQKIDNKKALIKLLQENTSAIKRPIVCKGENIVLIGFKAELFEDFFKQNK